MAEGYKKFQDFDWSDERWQTYLQGLYPQPNHRQVLKFKKKWYKKTIDPEFDDTFEPPSASPNASGPSTQSRAGSSAGPPLGDDGSRWSTMRSKATICMIAYSTAMTMSAGAFAGALPAYQAQLLLVGSFVLEILAKYGLKFNQEYLQSIVLDDVGPMPIMALTVLTPGLHQTVRILALVPPFITAVLSFARICKFHATLPAFIRKFFSPLAEISARYRAMQARADVEVGLGFVIVGGVFMGRAAPICALLFWNFMMMRYMMSAWTQASFRKIDGVLSPILGKIPGINRLYDMLKRGLYSFVDPQARQSGGRSCTIL
mmetsp:Transcript_109234/g.216938  ORF Transcript_109234/g.216938 Transcript_109234/m.216938 type:complete len:317 (-) Transcript_109234:56-1006(-)